MPRVLAAACPARADQDLTVRIPLAGVRVVELGAAVLMGVQGGNPLATLCRKHGLAMHKLQHACPLHDADGAL